MWKKLLIIGTVGALCIGGLTLSPQFLPEKRMLMQGAVALMPVPGAHSPLAWDLSQELGAIIAERLGGRVDLLVGKELGSLHGYERAILVEPLSYEKRAGKLIVETRLSYYDLTEETPLLLKEQTVKKSHPLPAADHLIDYGSLAMPDYLHTPLAVAHHRIGLEMAQTVAS